MTDKEIKDLIAEETQSLRDEITALEQKVATQSSEGLTEEQKLTLDTVTEALDDIGKATTDVQERLGKLEVAGATVGVAEKKEVVHPKKVKIGKKTYSVKYGRFSAPDDNGTLQDYTTTQLTADKGLAASLLERVPSLFTEV
jgi:hypothetical protein